jgi:hypothetical protein
MPKRDVHVVPHSDGWAVRREGAERASSVHDHKVDAIEAGRDFARRDRVDLIPHGRDGRIQNPNSYGHDPNPPRDRRR